MTELQGIMPKVGRYCAPKLRGLAMKWQVRGSTNHSGNPANMSTVRFSGIGAVALFGMFSIWHGPCFSYEYAFFKAAASESASGGPL